MRQGNDPPGKEKEVWVKNNQVDRFERPGGCFGIREMKEKVIGI